MDEATKIIDRPDGSQVMLIRCLRIAVVKGPDKGKKQLLQQQLLRVGTAEACALQLDDPAVSRAHLELRATDDGYLVSDLSSTNGTFFAGARVRQIVLTSAATLELGNTTLRLTPAAETVEVPLSRRTAFGGLLGQSRAMRQVFAQLERISPTDSTVLIEGESGTGKEVAAEAIHYASARREAPLVVVDCGAIAGELIESELFGYERGAFTDAQQAQAGALEQADGGTLFLDEVAELPLRLQPRLLRVLETQQVKRVGASRYRQLDLRIVAATNRRLANQVQQGRFREDLYYRLSVMRVELPPLRERPEDVLPLAFHFAEQAGRDPREVIGDEIAPLLAAHGWPGNARELRNVVERLTVLPEQTRQLLQQGLPSGGPAGPTGEGARIGRLAELPFHEARRLWQESFERQYLARLWQRAGGVVSRAAQQAQLPRQTLHRLRKRHRAAED